MKRESILRQPLKLLGIGAIIAVLAPAGVYAAASLVKLQSAKVLAQGDCDVADGYPNSVAVGSGNRVTGAVLTSDGGTSSAIASLDVTASSASGNTSPAGGTLFNLRVSDVNSTESEHAVQDQVEFGPGIKLTEAWTFTCAGAQGTWVVYGYTP